MGTASAEHFGLKAAAPGVEKRLWLSSFQVFHSRLVRTGHAVPLAGFGQR